MNVIARVTVSDLVRCLVRYAEQGTEESSSMVRKGLRVSTGGSLLGITEMSRRPSDDPRKTEVRRGANESMMAISKNGSHTKSHELFHPLSHAPCSASVAVIFTCAMPHQLEAGVNSIADTRPLMSLSAACIVTLLLPSDPDAMW